MQIINRLLAILFMIMLGASCQKNSTEPDLAANWVELGKETHNKITAKVFTARAARVGYNKIFIQLSDSATQQPIKEAQVTCIPMMSMEQMKHSAPWETPQFSSAAKNCFVGAIIFLMQGEWTLKITCKLPNNQQATITITVNVMLTNKPLVSSVPDPSSSSRRYYITLVKPSKTAVGMNDVEITIHHMIDMMTYQPVEDLTIKMTPTMPDMGGHGSGHNISPFHQRNGHYLGKFNCNMTGKWHIKLELTQPGGQKLQNVVFEVDAPR